MLQEAVKETLPRSLAWIEDAKRRGEAIEEADERQRSRLPRETTATETATKKTDQNA